MKNFAIFRKLSFCLLFLMGGISVFAQWGNSNVNRVEEERDLSGFDAIAVSHGIDVHLYQSDNYQITVKAKESVMDDIETTIKNGTLYIKMIKGWKWNNKKGPIDVKVSLPELNGISASGGSDVYGKTAWNVRNISLALSGGSDLEICELNAKTIECHSSGGSDIEICGQADRMEVNCSGGSDVDAQKFKVRTCSVNASGGSDVEIYVTDDLTANASGASDISYRGSPNRVKERSSGSSDIEGN